MFQFVFNTLLKCAEAGQLPDALVRMGIRKLLADRASRVTGTSVEELQSEFETFLVECSRSPVACLPQKANEQHYEVPAELFQSALGPRLKYSCCQWDHPTETLQQAEVAALQTTCARAELVNGQRILELGCGWGSLSLWMAQQYPQATITAVSNSNSQREFIERQARHKGFGNLRVVTADMNDFCAVPPGGESFPFDRVVSVEMFEHMRNHAELLRRISDWLVPGGKLFVHIFCHRSTPYLYEDHGPQDWMTRYFFSGGMMPSDQLFARYQADLQLESQWRWNGQHYARTCNAWLRQFDANKAEVWPVLARTYGHDQAAIWWYRWRIFFMACAELFAFHHGNEWYVSHYRWIKPPHTGPVQ